MTMSAMSRTTGRMRVWPTVVGFCTEALVGGGCVRPAIMPTHHAMHAVLGPRWVSVRRLHAHASARLASGKLRNVVKAPSTKTGTGAAGGALSMAAAGTAARRDASPATTGSTNDHGSGEAATVLFQTKRGALTTVIMWATGVHAAAWTAVSAYSYQTTGSMDLIYYDLGVSGVSAVFLSLLYIYSRHFVRQLSVVSSSQVEATGDAQPPPGDQVPGVRVSFPMLRIQTMRGPVRYVRLVDVERVLANSKPGRPVPDNVTLRVRGDRSWYMLDMKQQTAETFQRLVRALGGLR